MARFLVTAMPFTGHVSPLRAVAEALLARGHDVRFFTGPRFRPQIEASGAHLVPWRQAPDFDENDLAATFPRLVGEKSLRQVFINLEDVMIATAPAQVADLEAEWGREPWDVIVAEETSVGAAMFAEKQQVTWATVAVLPLNITVTHGPPAGLGLTPGTNPITKLRDAALRAAVPLFARPLQAPIARARAAAGLPASNLTFEKTVFSPRLVLASGSPLLDFDRRGRPAHVEFVGTLVPASANPSLPDWWGDLASRRVVHVTQGTQNIDPSDLLQPAIEALADTDALVVATTGLRDRDELPFPVPGNVRVAGFIPYDELLPRTDVVITNGGWGGTLRALSHGIPLVVAGGDLDKPEIAARIAWTGAGVNLKTGTPTAAQVAEGYGRIVADGSFRDAAARVGTQLRALGGADAAAQALEKLV